MNLRECQLLVDGEERRSLVKCDDAVVRLLLSLILTCSLGTPTPALASTSHAQLWTTLDGEVVCGVAIHPIDTPPMQLLCSSRHVPPPKGAGIGDPGFVFLGSAGRPSLARLSQDSFVGQDPVALKGRGEWAIGPIAVTCKISATAVRCSNHSHHGFRITKSSYRPF